MATNQEAGNLLAKIAGDQSVPEELRAEAARAAGHVLNTNPGIYYIVTTALGLAVLSCIVGAIILTFKHTGTAEPHIPELLTAIGSAAVGALAGLLAPSPRPG